MPVDNVKLMPEKARVMETPETLVDDFRKRMGKLIDLNDKQKARIKQFLKDGINEWKESTSELHNRLEEDNDLVEGIIMETDFPWEGASNVHVPITEMYMEIYKSIFKRSILGADIIWYATSDDEQIQDFLPDIENFMNDMAKNKWNVAKALENVFWTTCRDGLGIIQVTWAEEYKKSRDILLITNVLEFVAEFPSPEDAGVTEEQYTTLLSYIEENASEEFPIEIPMKFDKRVYYGCKADIVELVNFVTIPATIQDLKDPMRRGYGKRYWDRAGNIKKKAKDGVFYKDAVNKTCSANSKSMGITSYLQAQDEIEGLSRENSKDQLELYELVITGRLDGDEGEEEDFLVTWNHEKEELLQFMEYPYRVDFYALFRINERPNRLIGRSVPVKTRDMNDEMDTQHNQRINARTVTTVPSFKALSNKKTQLDPNLREWRFGPGKIMWLEDFEMVEQWKIQPTDLGESLQEENNDMRILDQYLGSASALLSGTPNPADPDAPGNKTQMLIQQSNLRMDDPLSELRHGVKDLGEICLSHTYQFGPPILQFQLEDVNGGREIRTIHKKYLRRNINLNMRGVTITMNPDAEMARTMQLYGFLMSEPEFQQYTEGRIEVLRDALKAGRIAGRDRYLPPLEQIRAKQVEIQKQAMQQMLMERQAQAQQAQQEALKQRLGAANQDLKVRNTARKLAQANLNGARQNGNTPAEAVA